MCVYFCSHVLVFETARWSTICTKEKAEQWTQYSLQQHKQRKVPPCQLNQTQHTFRYIGGGRLLQLKVLGLAGYWAGGSITE
jgi:hypothetical protein